MRQILSDLAGNLRAGLLVALNRPVSPRSFASSLPQFLLLLTIDSSIIIVYDFCSTAQPRYFTGLALALYGSRILVLIAIIYLMSRLLFKSATDNILFVIACALPLPLILFQTGYIFLQLDYDWLVTSLAVLWLVWLGLISYRGACISAGAAGKRIAGVMIMSIIVIVNLPIPHMPLWFHYDSAKGRAERPRLNVEDTFYAQQRLMDRLFATIEPQRAGVIDLYFVGFGGYAKEDVFMKEVDYVKALFDRRFATQGRSLNLINHHSTVNNLPLANVNNLGVALERVGRLMDVDEDVLFLYLTSHGSEDAELAVTFWPLELNELTPERLASLLAASGIRWRVIVISACYSGAFINALKDPHTLIITAAAQDRSSFGCSHQREFTYFGEAYFRDQLETKNSYIEAFYAARDAIEERERSEDRLPSRPQIRIGAAVVDKLGKLERSFGGS